MHAFYAGDSVEDSKAKSWLTCHQIDWTQLHHLPTLAWTSLVTSKFNWVVLFTCLSSRAVHLELIDSLDTSTFKNALHCFLGIRGKGSLFRNDKGKNFVGSRNQGKALNQDATMDINNIRAYLNSVDSDWIFNSARASHFGGV